MASGRSLELAKIQPRGPVLVANDDLPPKQSQPGGGPTRRDMRAHGRRSDSWTAKRPRRVPPGPPPSIRAAERHLRRMERRSKSVGLVMVKPPAWGAKHTRAMLLRDGPAIELPTVEKPQRRRRVRVPWKPASRERIYQRQTGREHLTPRQLRSIRRAENRILARSRKGSR